MKPVPWRRGLPEASRGVTSTTDRLLSLKILSVLAKAGEAMSRMNKRKEICLPFKDRITIVTSFKIMVSGSQRLTRWFYFLHVYGCT
jgi:hypothetical protein